MLLHTFRSAFPSGMGSALLGSSLGCLCLASLGVAQCTLQGNFSSRHTPPAPTNGWVRAVRPLDLDGDSRMDLAVNRNGGSLEFLRNAGNGTFAATLGPSADHFEVADFDGDGLPDLLVTRAYRVPVGTAQHWQAALEFWRNATTGTTVGFQLADVRLLATPSLAVPNPLLGIADLDVDGILDVAVLDRTEIHVVRGAGNAGVPAGAFGPTIVSPSGTGSMFQVVLVDVDHDGALDFVCGTGAWARVHHGAKDPAGRPNGSFGPAVTRQLGTASGFPAFADLDGDGWLDHVATAGNQVELRRGQPGFTFAAPVLVPISAGDMPFVGDFDRDGRLEVCVPRTTQWWNGNVAFVDDPFVTNAVVTMEIGAGAPVCGTAVDLDGNDWLDFAIGKQNGELVCGYNSCFASPAPQVTVQSPNGGESWSAGTQRTVQWTTSGPQATFDVDLSIDGGATWRPLARAVPGTRCQVWVTEPSTATAVVRVQPTGHPGLADLSDQVFSIGALTFASAQPFGQGCGVPSGLNTTATPPQFGQNSVVSVAGAVPGTVIAGWLSLPAAVPLPLLPGCALHLDLAFAAVAANALAGSSGQATLALPVPSLPVLAGLQLVVQPTTYVPAAQVLQIGNPVLLRLGF